MAIRYMAPTAGIGMAGFGVLVPATGYGRSHGERPFPMAPSSAHRKKDLP